LIPESDDYKLRSEVAKAYNQYCPIAHALDVVGERWSLLVVRELSHGPLRYTDLLERLHGCSTNVLATRLRELEANGVIRREKLPAPAASTVYTLTSCGEQLRPVLASLAHWGLRTLGPPPADALEAGWLQKALQTAVASFAGEATIGFRIGDEQASVVAGTSVGGIAADADAVVSADALGLYHLFVDGRWDGVEVEGDRGVVERLVATVLPAEPVTAETVAV
jgi:DNA-binding HxlR family transcriptional regulator